MTADFKFNLNGGTDNERMAYEYRESANGVMQHSERLGGATTMVEALKLAQALALLDNGDYGSHVGWCEAEVVELDEDGEETTSAKVTRLIVQADDERGRADKVTEWCKAREAGVIVAFLADMERVQELRR